MFDFWIMIFFLFQRHKVWHQKYKGWCCFTCHLTFPDKESLLAHEKLHVGRPALECTTCGKLSKTKSILIRHVDIHVSINAFLSSVFYWMKFSKKFHLVNRCFWIFSKKNKRAPDKLCDFCGKAFNSMEYLKAHRREVHIRDWQGECETCGFTSFNRSNLVCHIKSHVSWFMQKFLSHPNASSSNKSFDFFYSLKYLAGWPTTHLLVLWICVQENRHT